MAGYHAVKMLLSAIDSAEQKGQSGHEEQVRQNRSEERYLQDVYLTAFQQKDRCDKLDSITGVVQRQFDIAVGSSLLECHVQ